MAFDPNVCIGFQVPEHPFPEDQLIQPSWLCPECDVRCKAESVKVVAAYNSVFSPAASRARMGLPPECIAGGHDAGSRYYDCIACYGD